MTDELEAKPIDGAGPVFQTTPERDPDYVTWHVPSWTRVLEPWIGVDGVRAIEVGSLRGRSAEWFAKNVLTGKGSYLVCVDAWLGTRGGDCELHFDERAKGLHVIKRKGMSQVILPQLRAERRRYHFGYVDGGHEAWNCLHDLVDVWEMILPGGVLIADDYNYSTPTVKLHPKIAIDAFLQCNSPRIAKYEKTKDNQVVFWKVVA